MTDCHEMAVGEIYMCEECGLELEVIRECEECGPDAETCECGPCTFVCCGEPLTLREAD